MADGAAPSDDLQAAQPCAEPGEAGWKARHLALLEELSEMAMGMARGLAAMAEPDPKAPGAPRPTPAELALTFTRVARAVRQTLALEARLRADFEQQGRQAKAEREAETLAARGARRREVRRIVRQTAHDQRPRAEQFALQEALDDRLDTLADDFGEGFFDQPLRDQVEIICEYLDIDPDWADFGDDDPPPPIPPEVLAAADAAMAAAAAARAAQAADLPPDPAPDAGPGPNAQPPPSP